MCAVLNVLDDGGLNILLFIEGRMIASCWTSPLLSILPDGPCAVYYIRVPGNRLGLYAQ